MPMYRIREYSLVIKFTRDGVEGKCISKVIARNEKDARILAHGRLHLFYRGDIDPLSAHVEKITKGPLLSCRKMKQ